MPKGDQSAIMAYIERAGIRTSPVDPAVLAEYDRAMREEVIPKIIDEMKANARRVAELRHRVLF